MRRHIPFLISCYTVSERNLFSYMSLSGIFEREEKFRFLFRIVLVVVMLCHLFVSILGYFSDDVDGLKSLEQLIGSGFFVILLLEAYLYCKCRIVKGKGSFSFHSSLITYVLLLLFLGWLYILFLRDYSLNGVFSMIPNFDILQNVFMKIVLAFFFALYVGGDRKYLRVISIVLVAVTTIASFSLFVLLLVREDVSYTNDLLHLSVNAGFFDWAGIGFGRLQINGQFTIFGMYAKTLILLCVYLLFDCKSKLRYLLFFPICLFYMILALTDSRAGLLATAVGLGMIAGLLTWEKSSGRKGILRFGLMALAFLLAFLAVDSLRKPVYRGYGMMRSSVSNEETEERAVERKLLSGGSGREAIYMAALESMKQPEIALFGVTPAKISAQLTSMSDQPVIYHAHNELLEIMLASGFPGLLIYLMWLCMAAWCGIKILFNVDGKFAIAERVLMIVCFAELVNNMFEACLTFKDNLSGYIFYLLAGYAVVLAHQAGKKMTA